MVHAWCTGAAYRISGGFLVRDVVEGTKKRELGIYELGGEAHHERQNPWKICVSGSKGLSWLLATTSGAAHHVGKSQVATNQGFFVPPVCFVGMVAVPAAS